MSIFDPDKFMEQLTDQMGDTKFPVIPPGDYLAMIDDVKARPVNTKNGESMVVDITFKLQIQGEAAKALGRDSGTIRMGIFPDLDAQGKLDMSPGKNIRLNQIRAAVGLEKGFTFAKLKGMGPVLVSVTQRQDKNSPDVTYSDIRSIGKA